MTVFENGGDNRRANGTERSPPRDAQGAGQAINESISGSGRVHDSIQRIREEGYNLYMVLDAKVGVNRR